jgi:hypothetical protein
VSTLEEIQDVFFKIGSGIDFSLIEERSYAACRNLARDLLRNPGILTAVAHENKLVLCVRSLFHESKPF